MQVTHVEADPTHVILGGTEEVTEFGISNDPAFFKILSSSLYSNQILAVVREVICNAWDAHIAAGKTDIPVDVRLDYEKGLSIRDYGQGIPHSLIGPIYTIYGGSTKKYDGEQTGGFGLGCKAPFAYTDTFTVNSYNEGVHTSYVMGFSSGEGNGRPTAHTLFSIPTTETGLEVALSVGNADFVKFRRYIQAVTYMGGMKVRLNGQELPTVDYTRAKHDFVFFRNLFAISCLQREDVPQSLLSLKYGNVIYPLTEKELKNIGCGNQYATVEKILENFYQSTYYNNNSMLVLCAPPDSVSVTPSRETLSFQENTINTVKGLLQKFIQYVDQNMRPILEEMVAEGQKLMWTGDKPGNLFDAQAEPMLTEEDRRWANETALVDATDLAILYYMRRGFSKLVNSTAGRERRLARFVELGLPAPSMQHAFKTVVLSRLHKPTGLSMRERFVRKYVRQTITDTFRLGLNPRELFWTRPDKNGDVMREPLTTQNMWDRFGLEGVYTLMHMATKTIVVGNRSNASQRRLFLARTANPRLGLQEHLFYYVSRSPKEAAQAADAFKKRGYQVLNMYERFHWDEPVVRKTKKESTTKTVFSVRTGIPLWSNVMKPSGGSSTTPTWAPKQMFSADAEKTLTPAWVTFLPRHIINEIKTFGDASSAPLLGPAFSGGHSAFIIRHFGKQGALCSSPEQATAFIKKGAVTLPTYLFQRMMAHVTASPEFANFLELKYSLEVIRQSSADYIFLAKALNKPLARQILNLPQLPDFAPGTKDAIFEEVFAILKWVAASPYGYAEKELNQFFKENPYEKTTEMLRNIIPTTPWKRECLSVVLGAHEGNPLKEDQDKLNQILSILLKD